MLRGFIHQHFMIRSEDRARVMFSFLNFFAVIAAYYLLKPARSSLFLKHWSANDMPYAYLTTAVVIFVVAWGYGRLTQWLNRHQLLITTYIFTILLLGLFWVLFREPSKAVALGFYVWVSIFNVLVVTLFWSYTNDVFRPAEGKRYYGLIGTGGILGSIVGAFATRYLVRWTGTENLLLVTAGILGVVLAAHVIAHRVGVSKGPQKKEDDEPAVAETEQSGFALIRQSKYLMLIGGLVITATFFSSLLDFQFNKAVELRMTDKDAMTAYFGTIFGIINVLSFTVQLFVTSFIQRHFGIGPALMVTPVLTLLASGGYAVSAAIGAVTTLKVISNSLEFSLAQATKELLYIPLGREAKYKAKSFIDMAFFRFGDALSAVLILGTTQVLHMGLSGYRYMNVVVGVIYVVIAFALSRTYVAKLRGMVPVIRVPDAAVADEKMAALAPKVNPEDFPSTEAVEWETRAQAKRYYVALLCLQQVSAEKHTLLEPLKGETDRVAKRLFRLLSLIHNPDDIFRSIHHLYLHKNHNDVIAEELLDNVLRHHIRNEVLPLFDPDMTDEDKIRHGRALWKLALPDIQDYLRSFLKTPDADALGQRVWLKLIQPL